MAPRKRENGNKMFEGKNQQQKRFPAKIWRIHSKVKTWRLLAGVEKTSRLPIGAVRIIKKPLL